MSSESPTLEPDTLQCSKGCHDTDPLGYHPPLKVGVFSHAVMWPVQKDLLVRIHIVKMKHYTRIFSTKVYVPLGTFHCISLKILFSLYKAITSKKKSTGFVPVRNSLRRRRLSSRNRGFRGMRTSDHTIGFRHHTCRIVETAFNRPCMGFGAVRARNQGSRSLSLLSPLARLRRCHCCHRCRCCRCRRQCCLLFRLRLLQLRD